MNVTRNRCSCHPEACACLPYSVTDNDGCVISRHYDESQAESLAKRFDALEAEVERLKQDAARWHWMRQWFSTEPKMSGRHYHCINKVIHGAGTVESVIDAAIAATETAPPSPQTEPRDASTDVKS